MFLICTVSAFLLTVLISVKLIPVLRAHKIGQSINEAGPVWHVSKSGTPMMGGLCFIVPILLVSAGTFLYFLVRGEHPEFFVPLAMTLFLGAGCGAIGFVDDYRKLIKKKNEGLKSREKMLLLLLVGAVYLAVMGSAGELGTQVEIPFSRISVDFGFLFWPFALLLIAGMSNSTNITDGIDGLATSITLTVCVTLTLVAFFDNLSGLAILSACLIGGMTGFLIFNFHPAKVIMGDTGSLFLGGILMGAGFMIRKPIFLVLVCLVFVAEAITSGLQIVSIRVFHKNCFRWLRFTTAWR